MQEVEKQLKEWLDSKDAQFAWRGTIRHVGTVALYEIGGMGVMILEWRQGETLTGWELFTPVSPSTEIAKTFNDFDQYHREFTRKAVAS